MMEKLIINTIWSVGFLSLLVFSLPANAANMCVNLYSAMSCIADSTPYRADWSAMCGGNVAVKGIGFCSSTAGSTVGQKIDVIETNSGGYSIDTNLHCWCKMTSPMVSMWVYLPPRMGSNSVGKCTMTCANNCASKIGSSSVFRAAMFSDLTD